MITLVSHFTLRNIPWSVIIERGVQHWYDSLEAMHQLSPLEQAAKFLQTEGNADELRYELTTPELEPDDDITSPDIQEQLKINLLGSDSTFYLKDGSTINMRLIATRLLDESILADVFTTFDLETNKPIDNIFLSQHHAFKEFVSNDSPVPTIQIYFGEVPKSLIFNTKTGTFKKFLDYETPKQSVSAFFRDEPEPESPKAESIDKKNADISVPKTDTKIPQVEKASIEKAVEKKTASTVAAADVKYESVPSENMIPEISGAKIATDSSLEAVLAASDSELQKRIEELEEKLEESTSENDALSEQLEEYKQNNRELKNSNKYLSKYISDQKEKNERLKKRVEQADKMAHASADEQLTAFCEDFDKENKELKEKLANTEKDRDELQKKLQEAEGKVTSLKGRLGKASNGLSGGLLNAPGENEKFNDEFGIAIFSALHKAIEKTPIKSNSFGCRAIDVWNAIINANPDIEREFQEYQDIKSQLMEAMKSNELERNFNLLPHLGMTYTTHTNNHWKMSFIDGDRRYSATHASTPSETKSGPSNSAKDLKNAFLYPG